MALVQTLPISVAVEDLSRQIASIRRKTKTLIDYYIYPDPVPTHIAAYDPRFAILDARLSNLGKLSYTNLAHLLDDSDILAGSYCLDVIDQLLNAVHGIQELFCKHYDRQLETRKPFGTVYKVLEYRERQLKDAARLQMSDPQRLNAEELRDANQQVGSFCRGAVAMINGRDRGKIAYVAPRDLLVENRQRLDRFGGAYVWWQCPDCEFKLRYHVSTSAHSNIHSTQEMREHAGVKAEYKSAWLVKSHLYQPPNRASDGGRRPSAPANPTFSTGRELAVHVASKHKGKNLPAPPLLQKFNVAIKGKCAEQVRRWDINFT